MQNYWRCPSFQSVIASLSFCLLLSACGTAGLSQTLTAGEPKNSIPFFEKSLIEEIHTIAVPPLEGDRQNWHAIAIDIFSSAEDLSVIPSGKVDAAMKSSRKDLSSLHQEERLDFLSRLGKTVHADAVLNGVFFSDHGRSEIILQIVSVRDSRILWWQAADLYFKTDNVSPSDQKKVLSSLLAPLMARMGKKVAPPSAQSKQGPRPSSEINQQTEKSPVSESRPAAKPAPKAKKPEKGTKPSPAADDISPM